MARRYADEIEAALESAAGSERGSPAMGRHVSVSTPNEIGKTRRLVLRFL